MPEACGESHPDHPELTCVRSAPCYYFHRGPAPLGLGSPPMWDGPLPPVRSKRLSKEAAAIGARTDEKRRLSVVPTSGTGVTYPGVHHDDWVAYASDVLHGFLQQRSTEFTTAEDVWPLVDDVEEKREMVRVVSRALSQGWMHEVAAKRLNGTYHTKDGVQFKMNKLVPVYQSLIC